MSQGVDTRYRVERKAIGGWKCIHDFQPECSLDDAEGYYQSYLVDFPNSDLRLVAVMTQTIQERVTS